MSVSMDIRLKKANKTYHDGDVLQGTVVINATSETKVDGISITCDGFVSMQISNKPNGVFDAFYNSVNKPITLVNLSQDLLPSGKIAAGVSEFNFEFPLKSKGVEKLYEVWELLLSRSHFILSFIADLPWSLCVDNILLEM